MAIKKTDYVIVGFFISQLTIDFYFLIGYTTNVNKNGEIKLC